MNTYSRPRAAETETRARREAIVALVSGQRVASQAELARLLARRGFRVAQATLSRDLTSLGIGKRPQEGGTAYTLPVPPRDLLDTRSRELELTTFVRQVRAVGNLLIVRTPPGNANGVARAIDLLEWSEIAGSIAGDDTILVVAGSGAGARRVLRRLEEKAGRSLS